MVNQQKFRQNASMSMKGSQFQRTAREMEKFVRDGKLRLVFFCRGVLHETIDSIPDDTCGSEVTPLYMNVGTRIANDS